MPELPEVETVRRGLAPMLTGRTLTTVVARRPDLRFPLPEGFARRLAGRGVLSVSRRAKFLLIQLEGGLVWLVHLGMSGRFHAHPDAAVPPADVHDHVTVTTDRGWTLVFRDPRRFGFMDLCAETDLSAHPRLARLGPEPLSAAFSPGFLAARLAGRTGPVKAAILDQATVAGMGNIYASESLFAAGVSPVRPAGTISGRRASRLVAAVKAVLTVAIESGGSTLRDHRLPSGEVGAFQDRFAVYGREGAPCPGCRCNAARSGGIRRLVQAGRATFYCVHRQG